LALTELRAWRDALVAGRENYTVNRNVATLKACLTHAYADESSGIESDSAWRRLEKFREANARREHHFTEPEIEKLIAAARKGSEAFANLVTAAYLTGARFGKLMACDVRHFDAKRGTVAIPSGTTVHRSARS